MTASTNYRMVIIKFLLPSKKEMEQTYYDPKTGFTGLYKFYKRVKETDPTVTLSDVKAFLGNQYTWQVNRQDIRPKFYRTILAEKPRSNYQMDVMVYSRYPDGKYKYMLNVIDVYSRYAMSIPLKSRRVGDAIEEENFDVNNVDGLLQAIQKVFSVMGKPKNVNSDQEFSKPLAIKEYFLNNDIVHHISDKDELNKQAIVERFNRTLALLLQRWRQGTGRTDWHNVLDDLVKNYNESYHRGIKAKPIDVWEGEDLNHQSPIYVFETELQVGDLVRIKLLRNIFTKGDALRYSPDIYVITEQRNALEDGRKLKKFRLRNLRTNAMVNKPREWWKDYELKKLDTIIERSPDVGSTPVEKFEDLDAEKKEQKRRKAVIKIYKDLNFTDTDIEEVLADESKFDEIYEKRMGKRFSKRR